jgi:tetratricopeptide (TPR) repeat protein
MAHAHQYNGDAERAEKLMQDGLNILGETVSPIRCRLLNGLGNIHSQQKKDLETAETYYRAALAAAEAASDPYFMGMSLVNISHVNHVRGNYSEGLATALKAMECFEKAGDKNGYLHAVGNAGSSALSSGKLEHAVKLYEAGVDVSKNQMSNRILSQLLPRLGRAYHLSDELGKAEGALDSAIAFIANEPSTFMAGATRVYRSLLRLQLGDLSGALEDAELALKVADATKDRADQLRAAAQSARAQALRASGQSLEALAASTVAADLFAQLKHIQEFDTEILLTHAQLLKVHGRDQEADVWIEEGRKLIDLRSASIPSEDERRIFRNGIKVNREVLRLASAPRE